MFRRYADDPLGLDALEDFFGDLYWSEGGGGLDKKHIIDRLEERRDDLLFPFEAIARDFRLIESDMRPVPIRPESEASDRQARRAERVGRVARALQSYVVQLHPQQFVRLLNVNAIQAVAPERFGEQFFELVNETLYQDDLGLSWDDPAFREPEANII